jgi:hypothetical protein
MIRGETHRSGESGGHAKILGKTIGGQAGQRLSDMMQLPRELGTRDRPVSNLMLPTSVTDQASRRKVSPSSPCNWGTIHEMKSRLGRIKFAPSSLALLPTLKSFQ